MAGGVAGALSGLLGIGGGVIVVPVMLEVLHGPGAGATAIGTAHALVLLASIAAAVAHGRAGRVDRAVLRAWLPAVLAGAGVGLAAAPFLPPALLLGVFALVAAALAVSLLRPAGGEPMPGVRGGLGPPAAVGALAAALGIGGGTLSGPVLALLGQPLARVVGAGAVFNIVVALPATLVFGLAGQVALVPLVALTLPAMLAAPIAARAAPGLPVALLRRVFALVLLLIAARMLHRLLA